VADEFDAQVAIHTDTLNEAGFVEDTIRAIAGRAIHTYYTEGREAGTHRTSSACAASRMSFHRPRTRRCRSRGTPRPLGKTNSILQRHNSCWYSLKRREAKTTSRDVAGKMQSVRMGPDEQMWHDKAESTDRRNPLMVCGFTKALELSDSDPELRQKGVRE
jgi:hypothetical protein